MAGAAGAGHGCHEILQENQVTPGMVISSIGPPAVPEQAWNGSEPAMSLLPNYLIKRGALGDPGPADRGLGG